MFEVVQADLDVAARAPGDDTVGDALRLDFDSRRGATRQRRDVLDTRRPRRPPGILVAFPATLGALSCVARRLRSYQELTERFWLRSRRISKNLGVERADLEAYVSQRAMCTPASVHTELDRIEVEVSVGKVGTCDVPSELLEMFEGVAAQTLDEIAERFELQNVVLATQTEPSARDRVDAGVPEDREIFGLYRGVPMPQRGMAELEPPSLIYLFKGPLLRACIGDEEKLRREIRNTVLHEVGHHLGMAEEDLPF